MTNISTKAGGSHTEVPATVFSILALIGNAVMIGLIGWYLDHTLSSNRGTVDKLYFPCTRTYWGFKRKKAAPVQLD